MACKKSELVSAINSFGTARASGDGNLIAFSAELLSKYLDTLAFAEEEIEEPVSAEEETDE